MRCPLVCLKSKNRSNFVLGIFARMSHVLSHCTPEERLKRASEARARRGHRTEVALRTTSHVLLPTEIGDLARRERSELCVSAALNLSFWAGLTGAVALLSHCRTLPGDLPLLVAGLVCLGIGVWTPVSTQLYSMHSDCPADLECRTTRVTQIRSADGQFSIQHATPKCETYSNRGPFETMINLHPSFDAPFQGQM